MRSIRFFLVLAAIVSALLWGAYDASALTHNGYLAQGQSYTFAVDAGNNNYVEVAFTYPRGSVKFWVDVYGQDGKTLLNSFDLDATAGVITLQNGGVFFLTIYSAAGAGSWSATY